MKRVLFPGWSVLLLFSCLFYFSPKKDFFPPPILEEREDKDQKARFHEERLRYEFDLIKDPKTGKVPEGIFEREMALARILPVKEEETISLSTSDNSGITVNNAYHPAGPNNIGGRTRAVLYDVRYNGSSNRVIIAGSVSGGIMRSTDGGSSWVNVTPTTSSVDVHSFTALAQDPRPGFQDTWYAGGGELYGNSASEIGAPFFGWGLWKSADNGATWTKLTFALDDIPGNAPQGTTIENFDHAFDIVYRLQVHPTTGHLYIACHRRVVRSTDQGNSFQTVFGSAVTSTAGAGQTEVAITAGGKIMVAMNGANPDLTLRGVHISSTGARGSFQRIAGGQTLGVDSVSRWRANSSDATTKRIIMATAPSNQNIAYVFYENGLSNEAPDLKPEADLFRLNMAGGNFEWSNRSDSLPDLPLGNLANSDPLAVQGGYNMLVKVKPDNADVVFVGGTNLYRSTDGFATNANTAWINGYRQFPLDYGLYPNGHPDIHELVFNPSNANEAICGDDGGIRRTPNISAGGGSYPIHPVNWSFLSNYQTLQYYFVALDPGAGRNNFVGGAQDNGTLLRDKLGILGTSMADSNNHVPILGGDGTAVGFSELNISTQTQFVYGASQLGNIRRIRVVGGFQSTNIRPNDLTPASPNSTTEFGEFITNFRLNPDNTEDLYYVNFNRLFRTTAASSVAAGGWTELTGVARAVNPAMPENGTNIRIRGMAFSRGPYATSHALYLGTTNGKIFRLDNPRNIAFTTAPVDITPPGLTGNVQDMAVNPNNDDELLAVVSNYGVVSIWITTNAKSAVPAWRSIEGNLALPSIRSCEIVVKKNASNQPVTEYYVGTSVGLYSTTDISGSPNWQRESPNLLKFAVIRHMEYRPADNVMVVGTHGNGMFYTFLGTPNFTPNLNTGITPVTNDKNFIRSLYPTMTSQNIRYQIGNMFGVKRLTVIVIGTNGQLVFKRESGYQNGTVDLKGVPAGTYIISIYSDDGKNRFIQKVIKR